MAEVFEDIKSAVDKISKGLMYKKLFTYSKKEQQEIDYYKTEMAKFINEYKDSFFTLNFDNDSRVDDNTPRNVKDIDKLRSDFNGFLQNVISFCKITEHPGVEKELPTVSVGPQLGMESGYYHFEDNYINVCDEWFEDFCNGELDLANLIDTLGHEMEHWSQHYYQDLYDTIPPKYQPAVFNYIKQQVNDINKLYQIMTWNASTVVTFTDCFNDKVKPEDIPKEFGGDKELFFSYAIEGSYLSSGSEKDAREAGRNFVSRISYELPELNDYINQEETENYYYGNEDTRHIQNMMQAYNDMVKILNKNLSEEDVLKIANTVINKIDESQGKPTELPMQTVSVVDFLLAGKTNAQKLNLLKGAVKDNNLFFARILIDLKRDVDYNKNKDKISNILVDSLTEVKYKPSSDIVNFAIGVTELTQKDIDKLMIISLLKKSEFLNNPEFVSSMSENNKRYYDNFISKCHLLKTGVYKGKLPEFNNSEISHFEDVLNQLAANDPDFVANFKDASEVVDFLDKEISKLEEKNNKNKKGNKFDELTPEQLRIIDDRKLKAYKQEDGISLE